MTDADDLVRPCVGIAVRAPGLADGLYLELMYDSTGRDRAGRLSPQGAGQSPWSSLTRDVSRAQKWMKDRSRVVKRSG